MRGSLEARAQVPAWNQGPASSVGSQGPARSLIMGSIMRSGAQFTLFLPQRGVSLQAVLPGFGGGMKKVM